MLSARYNLRLKRVAAFTTLLAGLVFAGSSVAVDGVLEINQTCATGAGCFPGDGPGFPVEISNAGSHRLTGNLTVPDANTTAIEITSDDVTLDLNGFTISGVTDCGVSLGDPCVPTGSGQGISSSSARTTVRNGTVRGMGAEGVFAVGTVSRVEGVTAASNGGVGIIVVEGLASGCLLSRNGNGGLVLAGVSIATNNIIGRNEGTGLKCSAATCTITGNAIQLNDGAGIDTTAGGGDLILGNVVEQNVGAGLMAGPGDGYGNNVFSGNADGTAANQVSGFGVQIGQNLCAGVLCP